MFDNMNNVMMKYLNSSQRSRFDNTNNFEAKLHPFTLVFADTNFEKQFRKNHFIKSISVVRIALLTSAVLYAAFGFLDKMSSPQAYFDFFVVRYYIVIPILLVFLAITFLKSFHKSWQITMSAGLIVAGVGIIYMLHRDPYNLYYYGGLFLIFMGGYFYLKLRFVFALSSGILLIIIYTLSYFIVPKSAASSINNIIVGNAFFLASNIICMIGLYSSEKLERIGFYRLNLLNKSQNEIENINLSLEEKVKKRTKALNIAKEKAQESDKLKTEFLHNMSHEIRTPMNGIMGFSNLLCELEGCSEIQKNYSKIIRNSSVQLLSIIDDILEISTLETKQLVTHNDTFDVNQMLMELFAIYDLKSKERNLPLYLNKAMPNKSLNIISDRVKINKILSNLLDNAFKFTSDGKIEFGYLIEDRNIIFFVKDTGIGILPEKITRIFERFSQESDETAQLFGGLGLGLSIAKENTELLGGNIKVESEKGKGTSFHIEIPNVVVLTNADLKEDTLNEKENSITVLIAEDEEVNYLYLETILGSLKAYKVKLIHASDGEKAVEECLNNDSVDLVLMDIKMPVMNGYIAAEKIKKVRPHLPIIAQTAYSTSAERELALNNGCDDFISKPIIKKELILLINKHLS